MALYKSIEKPNGVVLSYHRVANISSQVNQGTTIIVVSYISQDKRNDEVAALKAGEAMDVFMESSFYQTEYSDGMTASKAYEHLKTLEDFQGSQDV